VTLNLEHVDSRSAPEPDEPAPVPVLAEKKPFWRRPWVLPLAAVVAFHLYMSINPFIGVPEAQAPIPPHDNFPAYYPVLIVHMVTGTIAMLTMVLQVWPRLREKFPKVHRVSGRVYVVSVVVAALAGFVVIWFAVPWGKVGSLCMLIFWVWSTVAGYVAIRRGNHVTHRRYMLYSFAVSANNMWASITMLAIFELGLPFDLVWWGEAARWIPWVGNLMLVQWWLYYTARKGRTPLAAPEEVRV
jgi:uncharacterized membrane protein